MTDNIIPFKRLSHERDDDDIQRLIATCRREMHAALDAGNDDLAVAAWQTVTALEQRVKPV